MTDLASLRPADGSAASIAAALHRTELAAKGAAAEIGRIRETRARLLMSGNSAELAENGAELARATTDGSAVMELHAHLQRLLQTAAPEASLEAEARATAFEAANNMARWWTQHGSILLNGLQLMAHGLAAISEWQTAAAHVATPPASNVAPFQRPVA